jgi:S1-C subfamily serine protease
MQKKYLLYILLIVGMFLAGNLTAEFRLNPIKPAANNSGPVTDEQQAILAVRKAKASVVNITVKHSMSLQSSGASVQVDSVYGTGIIVSADGYIVTNSHVVSVSEGVFSTILADGSSHEAKLVGIDKYHDIAVLKVEAANWPAATFGNSDDLETGQSVFAIGNSLGRYQNTVSRGVVAGLSRGVAPAEGDSRPRFLNLIQTDAAINVGNSGGPLVNMNGEVIGVNTLIDNGGESLGFAIPANTVKTSIEQLKKFGKASAPFLGVSFVMVDEVLKNEKSLSVSEGAYIVSVVKGESAEKAGIRAGDVIVEINREKLTRLSELDKQIAKRQAGDQILVVLYRGKEKLELPVIVGEYK